MTEQTAIAPTYADFAAELQTRYAALIAAEPKLRIRDLADKLGVSEAALVAAQCGVQSQPLAGGAQTLFKQLGSLGRVLALSRNDACVHERHGRYEDIHAGGPVGMVLGPDIDLRLFFSCWQFAWHVTDPTHGRESIQFFAADGSAVHKVYRTDETDARAWQALVAAFAQTERSVPQFSALATLDEAHEAADANAVRNAWLALDDTHAFFPMLRKFKLSRLGALRAAGPDLAQSVDNDAVETLLQRAADTGLAIMCFVGNRGIVQIHSGPVQKLLRTGPWFNVLDPTFNLHLQTTAIHSSWVVNKPTRDGWVTSLEIYNAAGELIVQFFGVRKPGQPELPAWRALLTDLCAQPLAA
ncbi:hemin-degrading factor [Amantichitinum ursilacus]|uniref:Hemin transport protein HemS n=1 Tax=Amantichitinum ursilacus TaxID=857265 RepID=A0A0N1JTT2_9NEIS|nr:hemin-degrading factor [Amantichitinum ursilacus]KPC55327.1 Hemin transport protein HemS [Amantichitinum ursilacus]